MADKKMNTVHVVGAGLAGSECAYQLAQRGHKVRLYEMRGQQMTPAHRTSHFAELVCSNSFGSQTLYSAPGQLKWEASQLDSLIFQSAQVAAIPAGMALGVDRELFAKSITEQLRNHPNIEVVEGEVKSIQDIPRPAVIATGPLTHPPLAESLKAHFAGDFLYFFDAIAPTLDADTIDMNLCWRGDRFGKGSKDYINCPLTEDEYKNLVNEISRARSVELKEFEKDTPFFESCMPIEEIVRRGPQTLRFGPLSPKGLPHPATGHPPYAVVQLRQENREGTAYNMVGFQTKMAYPEQKRIFRMIPGLQNAEFHRLGSMHRNMYINAPKVLTDQLSSRKDPLLFFAGQITGVEGYFESTCMGLLVALFLDDFLSDRPLRLPPRETAFGALFRALREERDDYQPTNINFGLFPSPQDLKSESKVYKEEKRCLQLLRATRAFSEWRLRRA